MPPLLIVIMPQHDRISIEPMPVRTVSDCLTILI
jgi:hypothetical protein